MMARIRFLRAIKERPIEIIASIIMIGIGIFLSLSSEDSRAITSGSILSTIGGVLLSWATATVADRDQASELLRPQLETTSRHLGSISSQLSRTILAVNIGKMDTGTGFALVSQANKTLYNLVTDIQILAGTPFDARGLLQTIDQIEGLASKISDNPYDLSQTINADDNEVPFEIASELQSLRSQLSAFVARQSTNRNEREAVNIECPYCNASMSILVPIAAGSTEVKHCANCSMSFNVHRKSDGSVFSRQMGNHIENSQNIHPYLRILNQQGIQLVAPKWRQIALATLSEVFIESPEKRVPSFEDLENLITEKLEKISKVVNLEDVKKIRLLAYRAKLFRLLGPHAGIELFFDATKENIDRLVIKNLILRIASFLGPHLDAIQLNMFFFDGDPDKLEEIEQLIKEVSDLNIAEIPTQEAKH